MSTPAEIIAARVNGQADAAPTDATPSSSLELTDSPKTPSVTDESAFPTLGGKKASFSTLSSWGPLMKKGANASESAPLESKPAVSVAAGKFKSSTIQEAFSLDVEDQLNVARTEFIKILTQIRGDTDTNIECTTSQHTKKRTFLITGKPAQVRDAKRMVIKRLTKPVKISFDIPAKVRSRVIGQQGRTLKPIIADNDVKIDIGNPQEVEGVDPDDIYSLVVTVSIEGDVEGCKHAKGRILAIVKDEIKELSVRLPVDDALKPFVANAIAPIISKFSSLDISAPIYSSPSNSVTLVGDRELVLEAKQEIIDTLEALAPQISTQEVPIPKLKHQFLPIDDVLRAFNVLIQLPKDGESSVKFVGKKQDIPKAQEMARSTTSLYKVEALDMAKAHNGNLTHVKAVATLLKQNGTFDRIGRENDVSLNVPDVSVLADSATTSVPIEIVVKNDQAENTKNAKKAIVANVNSISPSSTKVISDIDSFLMPLVKETIKDVTEKNNVSFVILGSDITLFNFLNELEDFDFVDTNEAFTEVDTELNKLRELQKDLDTVVLKVSSSKQREIAGPRNTTLKLITDSADANSVQVKLHSNADEVLIRGVATQVAIVKDLINAVLSDAGEHGENYSSTAVVASSVLSRLIGKNGANMTSLREKYGVKINVPEHESEQSQNQTSIIITGPKFNVEECKKNMIETSKKWADETVKRLNIESKFHRRLIGANGVYITRLQDKYNVKIRFPSAESFASTFSDAPKHKDEVTVKGPSKGVAKAVEELEEFYQFQKENGFQEILHIPAQAISRVIGKSGATINDIADGAGVEYHFKKNAKANEEENSSEKSSELELIGSKSALREAKMKIQDIINEVENTVSETIKVDPKYHRDIIGSGGSKMKEIIANAGGAELSGPKYYKLMAMPSESSGSDEIVCQGDKQIIAKIIEQVKALVAEKEASVSEQYELPKEKHGRLVGPGGSVRHALEDEFKVSIAIPRPSDMSSIIKLTGLPENIAKLRPKLDELTKNEWKVELEIPEKYHILVSERGGIFRKLKTDFNIDVVHGNLTRKASKLTNASIPTPPEEAFAESEEPTKVTISSAEPVLEEDTIPWRLVGSEEDTARAAELIKERLQFAKEADSRGWIYASNPGLFSKVVGPQGARISQLRKKFNVFVIVPRKGDKHEQFIYLVGKQDAIEAALKEIVKLLQA